jgi:hypothetical protein
MRNAALMVAGVVGIGVGAFAISFIQPAYSDGQSNFTYGPTGASGPVYESPRAPYAVTENSVTQRQPVHVMPEPIAEENIAVQARRLPDGTPVAVRGTIQSVAGNTLILDRPDGRVHARLPGAINELRSGDAVTLYGHLQNRRDRISVRTDAVLVMTSFDEGRLFMPPSKLQSVASRNHGVTRAQAANALDYYRYNFVQL